MTCWTFQLHGWSLMPRMMPYGHCSLATLELFPFSHCKWLCLHIYLPMHAILTLGPFKVCV